MNLIPWGGSTYTRCTHARFNSGLQVLEERSFHGVGGERLPRGSCWGSSREPDGAFVPIYTIRGFAILWGRPPKTARPRPSNRPARAAEGNAPPAKDWAATRSRRAKG